MMKKWTMNLFLVFLMIFTFIVNGCGGTNTASPTAPAKVSGVAATGAPVSGTITVKDSSVPPKTISSTTAHNGSFSLNVAGFQAPYVLKAAWNQNGNAEELYALANGPGTSNINPLTNAAFAAAANVSDPSMFNGDPDAIVMHLASTNQRSVMRKLMQKLAQLFTLYGVTQDAEHDEYEADHTGLDALFDDVKIAVSNGKIIVTNRKTGGVIFQASVNNIDAGTFSAENMPGQPGQVDGATLYAANCSSCHGPLASSAKKGTTASVIQSAIKSNRC